MKARPCVSNIAWTAADDDEALEMLLSAGVRHLEMAPTRRWPDLAAVREPEARTAVEELNKRGISISGFQALLFGKPELTVFGADGGSACLHYLGKVCQLADWMGARALVFGSPKNRLRGALSPEEAFAKGREFFLRLGERAEAAGVVICLEPNPPAYHCDFLTTAAEAVALVAAVDSPSIRINLDMGELTMNQADPATVFDRLLPWAGHVHVSEPMLEVFDPKRPIHTVARENLRKSTYAGAVSLEMKTPAGGLPVVSRAVRDMMAIYFGSPE